MLHAVPRSLLLALALVAGGCVRNVPAPRPGQPVRIPAVLDERGMFVVQPVLANGERLRLESNLGSGPALIYDDVPGRLGLRVDSVAVPPDEPDEEPVRVSRVRMPEFRDDGWIPAPRRGEHAGHLILSQRSRHDAPEMDGYLGNPWFAGRTWTFDFPRGELLLRAPGDLPEVPDRHRVRLGFKRAEKAGEEDEWLPRIRVEIAGDSVDLLLSTGVDDVVSPQALREMGIDGPERQPISSVDPEVFQRWRARHPEWRVIEDAVDGEIWDLIEVPSVSVGGHTVGPVWFSSHGAGAGWLSNWTDLPVQGFLSANVPRHFRLTVDMEQGIAVFERP